MPLQKIVFFLLLLLTSMGLYAEAAKPLDGIVAVVNDEIITQSAFDTQLKMAKAELSQQAIQQPTMQELKQQVIELMIMQSLQLQAAKRAGIVVSNAELKEAANTIAQQRHMTVPQLLQAAQADGISTAAFTEQLHDQLIMNKLQQQIIGPQISVKPGEVDDAIRNMKADKKALLYRVDDILITLPEDPSPDQIHAAEAQAKSIIAKFKQGEDFHMLAAAQSNGQQALHGGDLGWRSLAELPTVFADAIENLQVGQIAGPIRAPNGLHIIRLAETKENKKILSLDEQRAQINDMLFRRKYEDRLQDWLQQMRNSAYVKIMLPGLKNSLNVSHAGQAQTTADEHF